MMAVVLETFIEIKRNRKNPFKHCSSCYNATFCGGKPAPGAGCYFDTYQHRNSLPLADVNQTPQTPI